MELFFQGILKALLLGLIESLKGTVVLFYLDKHIKERADQGTPSKSGTPRRRQNVKNTTVKEEYVWIILKNVHESYEFIVADEIMIDLIAYWIVYSAGVYLLSYCNFQLDINTIGWVSWKPLF